MTAGTTIRSLDGINRVERIANRKGDGKITINELDLHIAEYVKKLTDGKQSPATTKPDTIRDFPIAVKR